MAEQFVQEALKIISRKSSRSGMEFVQSLGHWSVSSKNMMLTGWDWDGVVSPGLHGKLTKDKYIQVSKRNESHAILISPLLFFLGRVSLSLFVPFWGNIHSGERLWEPKTYKVLPVTKWLIPSLYPQETFNTAEKTKQSVAVMWREVWNLVRHPKRAGGETQRKGWRD